MFTESTDELKTRIHLLEAMVEDIAYLTQDDYISAKELIQKSYNRVKKTMAQGSHMFSIEDLERGFQL